MTLVEKLVQLEQRMNVAYLQNKFYTFNHLASDRLRLLQRAMKTPEKDAVFELAQQQTSRWVDLLEIKVKQGRITKQQQNRLAGVYGRGHQSSRGKVLRRAY